MVLKNSISNTRKFFQKTIDNLKSFFSNNNATYQKLPKTPINNNHYHHPITSSSSIHNNVTKNRALTKQPRRGNQCRDETLFSKPKVDLVHQKLKEMENMVNNDMVSDEEHVSDVREFLYCYSRLRYAAYLDVVEHFFMEVYSDFFTPLLPLKQSSSAFPSQHASKLVGVGSYGGH